MKFSKNIYKVVYHTNTHEMCAIVGADNPIEAASYVNGKVMDVAVYVGVGVLYENGWNLTTISPMYSKPTDWAKRFFEHRFHSNY